MRRCARSRVLSDEPEVTALTTQISDVARRFRQGHSAAKSEDSTNDSEASTYGTTERARPATFPLRNGRSALAVDRPAVEVQDLGAHGLAHVVATARPAAGDAALLRRGCPRATRRLLVPICGRRALTTSAPAPRGRRRSRPGSGASSLRPRPPARTGDDVRNRSLDEPEVDHRRRLEAHRLDSGRDEVAHGCEVRREHHVCSALEHPELRFEGARRPPEVRGGDHLEHRLPRRPDPGRERAELADAPTEVEVERQLAAGEERREAVDGCSGRPCGRCGAERDAAAGLCSRAQKGITVSRDCVGEEQDPCLRRLS
jgi:hypothetical protein